VITAVGGDYILTHIKHVCLIFFMALIQNGFHSDNYHLVSYKQDSLEVSTEKHTGPHAK